MLPPSVESAPHVPDPFSLEPMTAAPAPRQVDPHAHTVVT